MGRRLQVEWHKSERELKQRYQSEKHGERRARLQALWLLRQGKRVVDRQRLKHLIGWDWKQAAHETLPVSNTRSI